MDEEAAARLAAQDARIAALATELAAMKRRAEQENTISLNEYARRIDFSRESARRRLLADPKLGTKIGGRWRVTP